MSVLETLNKNCVFGSVLDANKYTSLWTFYYKEVDYFKNGLNQCCMCPQSSNQNQVIFFSTSIFYTHRRLTSSQTSQNSKPAPICPLLTHKVHRQCLRVPPTARKHLISPRPLKSTASPPPPPYLSAFITQQPDTQQEYMNEFKTVTTKNPTN